MQGLNLFSGLTYQQYEAMEESIKVYCEFHGAAMPNETPRDIKLPENIAHKINKEIYQKLGFVIGY